MDRKEIEVLKNFIVIEGIDGAGTTTQLRILDKRLSSKGINHYCTFEPTDRRIGLLIRDILHKKVRANPDTVALLFAADRSEHLHDPSEGVIARTMRGEIVISDRYLFSSLAYQSVESGFDFVYALNSRFPLPELVFFIDTPPDISQERLKTREKRELFDRIDFQERVRKLYLKTFEFFKRKISENANVTRFFIIDGRQTQETISDEIWKTLSRLPIFNM